jgi:micrococcal nuclease
VRSPRPWLAACALAAALAGCGNPAPPGEGRGRPAGASATADTPPAAPAIRRGPQPPRRPVRPTRACTVGRIVDGDTFVCRGGERVRPIGFDAPELSQRPYGERARHALARWIPVGTTVQLEPDVQPRDRYGRTLAYVWRDTVLVNWVMLREGWAVLYTVPPNVQYADAFVEAQRAARAERRGLWAEAAFDCAPAEHRRGRC